MGHGAFVNIKKVRNPIDVNNATFINDAIRHNNILEIDSSSEMN